MKPLEDKACAEEKAMEGQKSAHAVRRTIEIGTDEVVNRLRHAPVYNAGPAAPVEIGIFDRWAEWELMGKS
jgi:hypothetical protein